MAGASNTIERAAAVTRAAGTARVRTSSQLDTAVPGVDDVTGEGVADLRRGVTLVRRALLSEQMAKRLRGQRGLLRRVLGRLLDAAAGRNEALFVDGKLYLDDGRGWRAVGGHEQERRGDDPLWMLDAIASGLVSDATADPVGGSGHWRVTLSCGGDRSPAELWIDPMGRITRMSRLVVRASGAQDGDLWTTTDLEDFGVAIELPQPTAADEPS